jgi:WD40 repeat protein
VVSAGNDGIFTVSDVATGLLVSVLEGTPSSVTVAHFDPSSHRVVGVSVEGTAQVWDVTAPYRRWTSPAIGDDCGTDVTLEEDRRFIAVSCTNHGTRVWDAKQEEVLATLPSVTAPGGDFEPAFPAVSAAGDLAAIAIDDTVRLYSLPGGNPVRTIKHPAKVNAVAFARTGHDLVSASVDGSLLLTRDGHESFALPAFPGGVDVVGFAPDGRVIAAGARRRMRVYDPALTSIRGEFELTIRARSLRISSDGRRMIIIPTNVKAIPPVLWDLENDRRIADLEGSKAQVFSARFVRGDREILTAGGDGVARRWDGVTGRFLQAYYGRNPFLLDAVLDPGGSIVITGGGDGLLRFWDLASGGMIWTLRAQRSAIAGIHFEGSDIVTRGFAGEVSRWALPALPASSVIQGVLRCLPLRFDEETGGLVAQTPCDRPVR